MVKQNPFSLYDFLGYFVPGAIIFYIILIFLKQDKIESINSILDIVKNNSEFQIDKFLLFIILSYCLGHLISYLSSITIERFANWKYGYPSKYLLGFTGNQKYFKKDIKYLNIFYRFILGLLLLPISLLDFILGKYLGFKTFYTKKLDSFLIEIIKEKSVKLITSICDIKREKIRKYDFQRLVSHYVYENSKNHQQKLINYVALYGVLRALALITCILFWLFIYSELYIPAIITSLVTYIYFMGFMKFYRRYSLEGLMIVAVDPNLKTP